MTKEEWMRRAAERFAARLGGISTRAAQELAADMYAGFVTDYPTTPEDAVDEELSNWTP